MFTFSSPIGNEEPLTSYELHICVKDYCFGRDDRLLGVSVMQLKDIVNKGNIGATFNFPGFFAEIT